MVSTGPWCSKSLNITVTLTVDEGYEYNSSNPGYQFTLAIYNKCGDGDSITYEEAIKHLEGEYFYSCYVFFLYPDDNDNIGVAPITQATHVRNEKSNIQGRSLNVIKVIFHTIRNCL